MQDDTTTRCTTAWHAAQDAEERTWLDQWARTELIPQPAWLALDPADEATGLLPVLAAC